VSGIFHAPVQRPAWRGKMLHAVLGGLVAGGIYNGLELLGLSASAQLMWTALVLPAAVIVDRLTRQGRAA
jgi:D-xylose transport system permease protein